MEEKRRENELDVWKEMGVYKRVRKERKGKRALKPNSTPESYTSELIKKFYWSCIEIPI